MKQEIETDAAIRLLHSQVRAWGLELQPEQLTLLRRYAELLAGYIEANVIGTKEAGRIVLDHILDSLSCLIFQATDLRGKIIDVGSGGGMPGIPLAIARADLSVALLEVTEKKIRFLRYVRESLHLGNVRLLSERAEEAGRQAEVRESYSVAVTRALASLPVVVEYCAPLVEVGGWIVAMKGHLSEDELYAGQTAAEKLGAELHTRMPIRLLPELEQKQRQIVVFRKVAPTSTGYPRRVGLANKRPLGK